MTGTNATRDPDSVLAAWLDEGPRDLPDATRRAILTALPTTPQARRGRFAPEGALSMNGMTRLAAAAILAAVAIGGLLYVVGPRQGVGGPPEPSSSPAASPAARATSTPTATMPALSVAFVSPWYGYSVQAPTGALPNEKVTRPGQWVITPGQGPWPLLLNLMHGDPHLDEIRGPVGTHEGRFVGASVALPEGMDLAAFRAWASPSGQTCRLLDPLQEPLTIDGVQATMSLNGCASLSALGGTIYDVVLVDGGRGYDFTIDGYVSSTEALAWLHTISLDPAAAPPASPAPPSP
jgi:hypothetical protein